MRMLHLSDVHFDAVYGKYPDRVRQTLKEALYSAFERAVSWALENSVDMVLIAGDICDRPEVTLRTEKFLKDQLDRLSQEGIHTVVIHGNHDPSRSVRWRFHSERVHVLSSPVPTVLSLATRQGEAVHVAGNGFYTNHESDAQLESFPVRSGEGYAVGIMHTSLASSVESDAHAPYMTTTLHGLGEKNYDYWALGHVHSHSVYPTAKAAYSGCLQGLNPNESGIRGGCAVDIECPGTTPDVQFIPFSEIRFETVEFYLDKEHTQMIQLLDALIDALHESSQAWAGYKVLVRIKLMGMTRLYNELSQTQNIQTLTEELARAVDVLHVEILSDDIMPDVDVDQVLQDSPFLRYIDQVLSNSQQRAALLDYAAQRPFANLPGHEREQGAWLEALLEEIGDEWVYNMVTEDDH